MTDTQLFLCVVVLFYISGRCLWRPAQTAAFRSILLRPYTAVFAPSVVGNRGGSLLLSDPLVPLAPVYLVDLPDMLFAPEGVAIGRSGEATEIPPDLRWMRYGDIATVERHEKTVVLNASLLVRCRTSAGAVRLMSQLDALRHLATTQRTERIQRELKRRFNLGEARRALQVDKLSSLRWSCNLWLGGILTIYTVMAAQVGYVTMTLFLLVALEAAAIHLGYKFYRLHKQIYPEENRLRLAELLKFLCCAPTVFHCVDAISSNLLSRFHPLVVAHLLCEPRDFDRVCTEWVRDLKYGKSTNSENERWLRAQSLDLVEAFLKTIKRPIERYVGSPKPEDLESKSYCPRCETQYRFSEGVCPECTITVVSFSAAKTSVAA